MKELAKSAGNEYGMLVDDGIFGGDVSQYIDTGSYVFNALLSASIYGGLPANKITAIAEISDLYVRIILNSTQPEVMTRVQYWAGRIEELTKGIS